MRFVFTLLIIFIIIRLIGQNPILQHYDVKDGLPSSLVYDINQDKDGLIWVGTDKGVSKFDGKNFINYTVKDGLPNNDIFGLVSDPEGKLWLNTFDRIAYIENGLIKEFKTDFSREIHSHQFVDENTHIIMDLTDNNNYLVTDSTKLKELDGFNRYRVLSYLDDDNYEIYSNTQSNSQIVKKTDGKVNSFPLIYNANARYLKPRKLGEKFYVPRDKGIQIYSNGSVISLSLNDLNLNSKIERIGYLKNGLLISTRNEALILNEDLSLSRQLDFISNLKFNNVFEDKEGNIWIATSNGLYFLSPYSIKSHSFLFGNSQQKVVKTPTKIIKESDGSILVATFEGVIYKYKDRKMTLYRDTKLEGLRDMVRDIYGKLWIASDQFGCLKLEDLDKIDIPKYSYRLEKKSNYKTKSQSAVFNVNIKALAMGQDNRMYMAHSDGVSRIDFEEGYYSISTIDTSRSYSIAQDLYGFIWIGRTSGISRFKDGKLVDLGPNHPLSNLSITDIVVDKDNGLWIGSDGYGLFHDKGANMCQIAQLDGAIIKSLFIDDENQIWAATNKGVVKITVNKDANSACSYSVDYYSISKGLASDEVNDIYVQNDTLIAATKGGVSIIPISPKVDIEQNAPLVIQNIRIEGLDMPPQEAYDLSYNQNDIRVDFAALSYQSLGMLQYQYKMTGIDTSWQSTTSGYREYQALNPGKYTFNLKASDINGVQIGNERLVEFIIRKPWWKSWWFIFGYLILSGLLIFVYFQNRLNRVRKEGERQNEVNQKFAELEMQALRSQMNPHFLFNALHSIQDYIFNNNAREANRYISSFAKLMRMILDASKEKYIYLDQELEMLRLYIELEQLRFEGKFDYQINVDSQIDKMTTEIPSLILQPFVENAINHGLMHRKAKGQLRLDIKFEAKNLFITLSDNGIGIDNSMNMKRDDQLHHKSQGVFLIKDRIDLMNEMYNTHIEFSMSQLHASKEDFPGTKIEIIIPDLT